MIGLFSAILLSLFFDTSFSSDRIYYLTSIRGELSEFISTYSKIELENNENVKRIRKDFFSMLQIKYSKNSTIKSTFDETYENTNIHEGKIRGGKIEFTGIWQHLSLKTYVEGRRYKSDSIFTSPGYGIIATYDVPFEKIRNKLHMEYRNFGEYYNKGADCTLEGVYKSRLNYSLFAQLKNQSVPYGIFLQDRRSNVLVEGRLSYQHKKDKISFFTGYNGLKSEKVASMNFKTNKTGISWSYTPYLYISLKGHANYFTKYFQREGNEKLRDYGTSFKIAKERFIASGSIWMKRFDYENLTPLDRDERLIRFNFAYGHYSFLFERRDINYIRTMYISNSKTIRRFLISNREFLISTGKISIEYNGTLYASILTPIYTDEDGFYERYWENNIRSDLKDSVVILDFSLKYKEVSKFKNDTLYAPEYDIEYRTKMKLRIFSKRYITSYLTQYAYTSKRNGTMEWRIGAKVDTKAYEIKFGIGKTFGKKNIYIGFSGWI